MKNVKDLHFYDFKLFWMSILENMKLRIDKCLDENRHEKQLVAKVPHFAKDFKKLML